MTDIQEQPITDILDEYVIISKNKNDILNDMDFKDEEERLICDSIITNMEKDISNTIRDMKCAQIPFIGCLRIDPIRRALRDKKLHLSAIRKNLTKEQYKEHIRTFVDDFREKQNKADRLKYLLNKIKYKNKKKYDSLYKRLGKAYANLFLMSIYWLEEVPYSQEWEEQYQKLSNRDDTKEKIINDNYTSEDIRNILAAQKRYKFK